MAEVIATLTRIRFQGDNNFIIGIFNGPDGKFGGLGNLLSPKEGLTYKLIGEWSDHSQYGRQFKFSRYYIDRPMDVNGIYNYLIRFAPGVGPAIANDLIYEFDVDALDVMKKDPERVSKIISGLSLKKAQTISEFLIEESEDQELMVELMDLLNMPGLRRNLPHNLIQAYGSRAAELLRQNPYIITQFEGTGFILADKFAIHCIGIDPKSMFRVKAAIYYLMKENENSNGNTWAERNILFQNFYELTGICEQKFSDGLLEMEIDGIIVDDESGLLAIITTAEKERFIAKKLKELIHDAEQ